MGSVRAVIDLQDWREPDWCGRNRVVFRDGTLIRVDKKSPHGWERRWFVELPALFDDRQFLTLPVLAQSYLMTTPGSNFNYTSDATWNNSNNSVEMIGAGGSGGVVKRGTNACGSGGGGGEYGKTTNFSFASPGTTTATCRVGLGGAAVTSDIGSAAWTSVGNAGGDTWFNGTTQAAATLGAIGGGAGQISSGANCNGGTGGTGGVGTTHVAGGRGGNSTFTTGRSSTGGGAAGGPTNAGGNGTDVSTSTGSKGGDSATATGGAAASANGTPGGTGGNGTDWTTTGNSGGPAGMGAGGGSWAGSQNSSQSSGPGGNYGGGGGGIANTGGGNSSACQASSGAGKNGIIVLTWTPSVGSLAFDPARFLFLMVR